MTVKQTAGRTALGDLAPKFAELNDDVLFGEVWSREDELCLRDRSLITVVALISKGITDSSLRYHISNARANGVTLTEMVEVVTHIAFYVGWPNAWAVFPLVREVYAADLPSPDGSDPSPETPADPTAPASPAPSLFGTGEPNTAFAQYFVGASYLKVLNTAGVFCANVTFEPGCRNRWHIHRKGGQILLCTDGRGWYQAWGEPARALAPGDVVYIAPEVKHWHGAAADSWFTHLAIEIPAEGSGTEWLEPVDADAYAAL